VTDVLLLLLLLPSPITVFNRRGAAWKKRPCSLGCWRNDNASFFGDKWRQLRRQTWWGSEVGAHVLSGISTCAAHSWKALKLHWMNTQCQLLYQHRWCSLLGNESPKIKLRSFIFSLTDSPERSCPVWCLWKDELITGYNSWGPFSEQLTPLRQGVFIGHGCPVDWCHRGLLVVWGVSSTHLCENDKVMTPPPPPPFLLCHR